jgi:hypothetical protein
MEASDHGFDKQNFVSSPMSAGSALGGGVNMGPRPKIADISPSFFCVVLVVELNCNNHNSSTSRPCWCIGQASRSFVHLGFH